MKLFNLSKKYSKEIQVGFTILKKNREIYKIHGALCAARRKRSWIFLAGNGGSAANANHLATDLIYGANVGGKGAFRVHALSANPSVLTCLGNDTGYENVFAKQLEALAQAGDLLLVFSGSGNSPNILRALEAARKLKMLTISFLGFDGGKAKSMSDLALHFAVHDMQVAEDLHMIAGHLMLKASQ